jgi:hypothetical protein
MQITDPILVSSDRVCARNKRLPVHPRVESVRARSIADAPSFFDLLLLVSRQISTQKEVNLRRKLGSGADS